MKAYADTNFFTRFYIPNPDLPRLSRLLSAYLDREQEPLPFTPLHRLEFRNAIRLMVHRRRQRGEIDLSPDQARQVLRDHDRDLDDQVFIIHRSFDWTEALREAERLSASHTEADGFRSLDLLHVGAAISLRCGEFYSFDVDARRIAERAGIVVLPARV
ncbi:MAG: hypothetical protein AB1705_19720 [Verrucomicrobiota bacterium]